MPTRTLEQWEDYLRPQITPECFLGEIEVTSEECKELSSLLNRLAQDKLKKETWVNLEIVLEASYPTVFVVYLVAQGKLSYDHGSYWPEIQKAIGIPQNVSQRGLLGRLFKKIVRKLGVAQFEELPGHAYVGPILAHGGIPLNDLDQFFEHYLQPWRTDSRYQRLSAADYLKGYSVPTCVVISRPMRRFFEYGNNVAIEFLECCRNLANRFEETGKAPPPEAVKLSAGVIARYEQWWQSQSKSVVARRSSPSVQRRPKLILAQNNRWAPAFSLPSQELENPGACWRLYGDRELLDEFPAEVRKSKTGFAVSEMVQPIRQIAREYQVEFCPANDEGEFITRQTWPSYEGVNYDCPLLVFNAEGQDYSPASPQKPLPAQIVRLLYPQDAALLGEARNELQAIRRLTMLPDAWAEFQEVLIDLRRVERVILSRGGIELEFRVDRSGATRDRAALREGQRLAVQDDGPPIYVGELPWLEIFVPASNPHGKEWWIELHSEAGSAQEIHLSQKIGEIKIERGGTFWKTETGFGWRLSSQIPPLAPGTYQVTVWNERNNPFELRFRFLPALRLSNHEVRHWPDDRTALQFEVHVPKSLKVQLVEDSPARLRLLRQESSETVYQVKTVPNYSQVALQLQVEAPKAGVYLEVALSCLRWKLLLKEDDHKRSEWINRPLELTVGQLEQSRTPRLHFDLFDTTNLYMNPLLELVDKTGQIVSSDRPRRLPGHRDWEFDLRSFRDTLRNRRHEELDVRLCLKDPDRNGEVRCYPVLKFQEFVLAKAARATVSHLATQPVLQLQCEAMYELKNQVLRLWNLWRPWKSLVELEINAEGTSLCEWLLPTSFQPGYYQLELVTPGHPLDIPAAQSMRRMLPENAPDYRMAQLKDSERFSDVLERLAIWLYRKQIVAARGEVQRCFTMLEQASSIQLLWLMQILVSNPDLDIPDLSCLGGPGPIRQLVKAWSTGNVSEDGLLKYLRTLPTLPWESLEILLETNENIRMQVWEQLLAKDKVAQRWYQNPWNNKVPKVGLLDRYVRERGVLPEHEVQAAETGLKEQQKPVSQLPGGLLKEVPPAENWVKTAMRKRPQELDARAAEALFKEEQERELLSPAAAQKVQQAERERKEAEARHKKQEEEARKRAEALRKEQEEEARVMEALCRQEQDREDRAARILPTVAVKPAIAGKMTDLIQRDSWVQTAVGWGRIKKIYVRNNKSSISISAFSLDKDDCLLSVLIRLGSDGEEELVEIDIRNQVLRFRSQRDFYICPQCNGFISGNPKSVRLHGQAMHGINRMNVEKITVCKLYFKQPLKFFSEPPLAVRDEIARAKKASWMR